LNLRTDIKSLRRHRLLDSPSPTPQTTTSQCAILESFMSALKSTLARAIHRAEAAGSDRSGL